MWGGGHLCAGALRPNTALDLLELDLQGLKELPNAGPLRKQPVSALNL